MTTPENTDLAVAPPCADPEGLPLTFDGLAAAHGTFDGRLYRVRVRQAGTRTVKVKVQRHWLRRAGDGGRRGGPPRDARQP